MTMAKAGDGFIVELSQSHVAWGTYRFTNSREPISGEGYIPIPLRDARRLDLFNGNGTNNIDIWGENLFECESVDGYFHGTLRAQGSRLAGDIYAKQFAGDGDLKALGRWYAQIGARPGDRIRVYWISKIKIEIEKL